MAYLSPGRASIGFYFSRRESWEVVVEHKFVVAAYHGAIYDLLI